VVELADTSAWAQRRHPQVRAWFDEALVAGEIAVSDIVAFDLPRSVASWDRYESIERALQGLPWVRMSEQASDRAFEVQRLLASGRRGQHRSVKLNDILVAATAEVAGMTVVHYDQDFDTISSVTGQPVRWIAARGSLD
jgi:predicted nucleic acid-binding protein